VVLVAIAIGVAVPVLLELRRTLVVARLRLDEGAAKVAPLLDQLERTTAALQRVDHLLDVSASVGQAVGPAIAAFISTWRHMASRVDESPGGSRSASGEVINRKRNGETI
jgi:hypothetical protein